MELWCNVNDISPHVTMNRSMMHHESRFHVVTQSTAASKVDQHTSSDLDLVCRFIDHSSLYHDVVEIEVSMSQPMMIKVLES